jgi:hypothetical protein
MADQARRTGTRSIDIPWRGLINMKDPDLERDKRKEIEYEFTKRKFTADPAKRGAYAPED